MLDARSQSVVPGRLALGAILAALLLVLSAGGYWLTYSKTTRAHRDRYACYLLADELRQSSDDLTRLVRSYAATGDERYEKWYWEVLAIRNGEKPRPEGYHGIYWDAITAGLRVESREGLPVSLRALQERMLMPAELALLRQAQDRSDALVALETKAMHAMKGLFADDSGQYTRRGEPDRTLALQLLFGPEYHQAKGGIMEPVGEFMKALDARTGMAVAKAEARARLWAGAFALSFLLLVSCSGASLWYHKTRVVRSLRESEERFRKLFEAAGDAMMLLEGGRFVEVNHAATTIFHCRPDDMVGRTPSAYAPPHQPDGRSSEEAVCARIAEASRTGHLLFEWQHLRADGTPFDAEVGLTRLHLGGRELMLATIRDISARKRDEAARRLNEARLEAMQRLHQMAGEPERQILHFALEEAVRLTGSELGYVAFVSADEKVLHMQSWSTAAMEACRIKDKPIDYPMEKTGLWGEAVRQRHPVVTNDYAAPSGWKKGTPEGHVPLRRHINLPVFDQERIVIVAGVGNKDEPYEDADVRQLHLLMSGLWSLIQRKRGEESLRALTATLEQRVVERTSQLEAANKELEAFSYSVSHDLRAPLRHVSGFSDMLQKHARGVLDEKGIHYLDTIREAAQKMGRLIDDLLVFSRMGRVVLSYTPVHLRPLLDDVIRDAAPETKDRRVAWDIGPLPVVQGDPSVLRQVFANLIGNALKYSRPRPEARIQVDSREEGGEHIVRVRDNGVGFDMKYVDKLFGVFQRLHGESEFEGTGIGLANVRRIIARHGGRTWAESRPGEGATFYFSLPAIPPPHENAHG